MSGKLSDLIEIDPEKMSGALVLSGTRVPINQFFDYLRARDSLNVFLDDFSTVTREQAWEFLSYPNNRYSPIMKLLLDVSVRPLTR